MALIRPSTLARVSSQPLLLLLLPLLVPNIFFSLRPPGWRFVLHPGPRSGNKTTDTATKGETQQSEGWQGAESRRGACQTGLVFVWREPCLDRSTRLSRVVQRRPPEAQRSGKTGLSQPNKVSAG